MLSLPRIGHEELHFFATYHVSDGPRAICSPEQKHSYRPECSTSSHSIARTKVRSHSGPPMRNTRVNLSPLIQSMKMSPSQQHHALIWDFPIACSSTKMVLAVQSPGQSSSFHESCLPSKAIKAWTLLMGISESWHEIPALYWLLPQGCRFYHSDPGNPDAYYRLAGRITLHH